MYLCTPTPGLGGDKNNGDLGTVNFLLELRCLKVVTPTPPPSLFSSRRRNRDENQLDCLCCDSNPCPGHYLLRRDDYLLLHALPTPY